jgi:anti-sigma regulatory factor (Ser/Thr protein kinase)
MTGTCLELVLPAVPASVPTIRGAVAGAAAQLDADPAVVDAVRLAVTEAATNVVRHAYAGGDGDVSVKVGSKGDQIVVSVVDTGVGISDSAHEADGGYGLRLIEILSSRCVITSRAHGGTRLCMVFARGERRAGPDV